MKKAGKTVSGSAHVEDWARVATTCFTAQVADVAVDPETGAIELRSLTTVHDVGRIVNPLGHQGQMNGAIVQGIGYALMEDLVVEDGRVVSLSFGDYKIPIMDIPVLNTVLIESDMGVGPYRINGIGEVPLAPVAPAIANAVAAAIGARVRSLPLTPEKVVDADKTEV